jgi:hypothetical protein
MNQKIRMLKMVARGNSLAAKEAQQLLKDMGAE